MKWRGGRQSTNIEDRRGGGFRFPGARRGGGGLGGGLGGGMGGGGMRMPIGRRGGLGGFGLIVVVVLMLIFGIDPRVLLQGGLPTGSYTDEPLTPEQNDEMKQFVSVVLADTEDTWRVAFADLGRSYQDPKLVLFTDQVSSACGFASAAVGPFYCPGDNKVYLDLSFFHELGARFGAPGDFAQAYVIAHEVGHHVQTLLGIAAEVRKAQAGASEAEANALSVRMELQADCLAGFWAAQADAARAILEAGDVEEALGAANAIGDDRLQRQATGTVVPDSFTHGTSEQRVRWFRRGLESGDLNACDTFNADVL
jgi:predicted metalloprotease